MIEGFSQFISDVFALIGEAPTVILPLYVAAACLILSSLGASVIAFKKHGWAAGVLFIVFTIVCIPFFQSVVFSVSDQLMFTFNNDTIESLMPYIGLLLSAAVLVGGLALIRFKEAVIKIAMVGMVVLGLCLLQINTSNVYRLESAAIAEQNRLLTIEQHKAQEEKVKKKAQPALAAEESVIDRLDTGGMTEAEAEEVRDTLEKGQAARRAELTGEEVPAYKRQGKVEREAGQQRETTTLTEEVEKDQAAAAVPEKPLLIPLPLAKRAMAIETIIFYFARYAFLILFALFVIEYLVRFHRTSGKIYPLPIGFNALSDIFGSNSSTVCHDLSNEQIKGYMTQAVKKGESFIYIGNEHLWANHERIHRLPYLLPVSVLQLGDDAEPMNIEFAIESAWFNRHCISVKANNNADLILTTLEHVLSKREYSRAKTARPVHLFWHLDEPMDAKTQSKFAYYARRTQIHFWLINPAGEVDQASFDEAYDEQDFTMVSPQAIGETTKPLAQNDGRSKTSMPVTIKS